MTEHKITDTKTGCKCACGWKCEGLMFPEQARVFAAKHLYDSTDTDPRPHKGYPSGYAPPPSRILD